VSSRGLVSVGGPVRLLGHPGLDRALFVAAIAPQAEVREPTRSRRLAHPGLGHGEKLGDFLRGQQALADDGTSFPQALQPGRRERATSSSLLACGYMCSISS